MTPPPLLRQQARDALFLHWAVPTGVVRPLLPQGVAPDEVDGVSYVGLVALRNEDVRPFGIRVPGGLASFTQVNVRIYGRDRSGRHGVVFLSMEVSRALPALVGRRGAGLPYRRLHAPFNQRGDVLDYGSRVTARIGEPCLSDPLQRLLSGPAGLFLRRWRRLWWLANEHPRWPVYSVDVLSARAPAGVPVPDRPPDSAFYSPGVPMVLRLPRRVG